MLRTHTCGELTKSDEGKEVTLAGWVHSRRDHGGIIFIDLRDRYGLTQVTFDPETSKESTVIADQVRSEWVIQVTGKVMIRPDKMINDKIPTGSIEIDAKSVKILNKSKTPPFEINEEKGSEAGENIRLKYRFIDLRRPKLQEMLKVRDELIIHIRNYFHEKNFREVQTPILANSSPEGARDWLVPSRLYPGKFYALPQAPQQFKQLLMVAGVDRYFQIAPCFRDEDPRSDRHFGEFYQLDMEMSFVEQDDIFQVMEPLMIELTEKFSHKKIVNLADNGRFIQIPWAESMNRFGTDKPDLRFAMELKSITDIVTASGFSVFDEAVKKGGVVNALKVDGGAKFSRKEIDDLTEIAKTYRAKGLAYIIMAEDGPKSPILKFLTEEKIAEIIKHVEAKTGDIIFFSADKWLVACQSLGAVRDKCGEKLGLKDNNLAAWAWITDFPMYHEEDGKIDFAHNPFSMPQGGLESLEAKDPLDILAYQYDFVLNGFELTSGAIRNHSPEIMYKAFAIAGYSKEQVEAKFGHMLKAFEYGAPPHGGNAPGIDRLLMVLNDWDSIRDIYAFPKDGQGRDAMLDAPSEVELKQLDELHLKIVKED
ncbi:aspartate--tRNA ligase [Candidatus Falkowbacteria bacterium]|uniref:Aspartate--tRNA(Asp/Asn) ligase n=1 Tax=Candidatus Buchananbacteria bacterium CG10_big_fil_rev_8_21_14_0_10_33_19 TaxID=1974525 RepID=A0A2H0W325_9BACT|nr:aspartate--tRNA ligase [Candidatus Falkowbacteria bacterium]PIS05752.1 MAG: aspartate--tRNA ligase [Candidatus Buchananbacteria bacterium CG10_big_fil_rev_8_21_14_0_10_33_19]